MEAITGNGFGWLSWIPPICSAAEVVRWGVGLLGTPYQDSSTDKKETATRTSFARTLRRVSEIAAQGKPAAVGAAAGVAVEAAARAAAKSEEVAGGFFQLSSWTKWGLIAAAGLGALYAWRRYWNGDGAGNHLTNTVNINVHITGTCPSAPPQVETKKENGVTQVDINVPKTPALRQVVERVMVASKAAPPAA